MAQAQAKKLAIAAAVLLLGGTAAVVVQQTIKRSSPGETSSSGATKGFVAPDAKTAATAPGTNSPAKVLVFRNVPSWNRTPDFEDTLAELGFDFEVKPSTLMESADLSLYQFVVIPGSQGRSDFYQTYAANAERFDRYVTNGGILVLELNGAENTGVPLPRGVNIVRSGSRENTILAPEHPILVPLGGQPIRANFASHGYLSDLPPDALVLVTETIGGQSDATKPTFVEYAYGAGRVIAACQCFHDRDGSGRGPLMGTALSYAAEKKWYVAKK